MFHFQFYIPQYVNKIRVKVNAYNCIVPSGLMPLYFVSFKTGILATNNIIVFAQGLRNYFHFTITSQWVDIKYLIGKGIDEFTDFILINLLTIN